MEEPPILTLREREVLPMLISGATRAEMARDLEISQDTVKLHVRNLLKKFSASSLRDGYERMSHFQSHYGNGTFEINFYNFDFKIDIKVYEKGKFAKIFCKSQTKCIRESCHESKYVLTRSENKKVITYCNFENIDRIRSINETIYVFRPEKILKPGDVFDFEVEYLIEFKDPTAKNFFSEYCLIPAGARRFSITFEPEAMPKEYGLDVHNGMSAVPNLELVGTPIENGMAYVDENPMSQVQYALSWQY